MNGIPKNFLHPAQIRAARGLLNWSQDDLADATALSIATIRKLEAGYISPRGKTTAAILHAFERMRIEFVPPMGVNLRSSDFVVLDGPEAYTDLLSDIVRTVQGKPGEVLFMYANNAYASREQIEQQLMMRQTGATFRFLSEEGNTHLHYPLNEYRWIPKKFYLSNLQIIYGTKVAACIYQGKAFTKVKKVIIIDSPAHAETLRHIFDFMWENGRKPTRTTAPQTYT